MINAHRHAATLLLPLLVLLCLPLWVDHLSLSHPNDGDSGKAHVSQSPGDRSMECADVDGDTVESDHADWPEYVIQSDASWPLFASEARKRYPGESEQLLPFVYLPVFSPPKITT